MAFLRVKVESKLMRRKNVIGKWKSVCSAGFFLQNEIKHWYGATSAETT